MPGALDHELAYQKTPRLADLQEIKLLCRLHARARDGRWNVARGREEREKDLCFSQQILSAESRKIFKERAGPRGSHSGYV